MLELLALEIERGRNARVPSKRTALILSDVEGCLTYDPWTYDHDVLAMLRRVNAAASWTNALPFLTLCTGRQAAFVEAFSTFLSVSVPVIFEGGCGLFFPLGPADARYAWHPLLEDVAGTAYRTVASVVRGTAARLGAEESLGKGRLLTFLPPDSLSLDALVKEFRADLAERGIAAEVTHSADSVDISVQGVNKGSAVTWLLKHIAENGPDLLPTQLCGVGDAPNDLSFLEVVGTSLAPANADSYVAGRVDIHSPYTDAKGVADAIVRAVRQNLPKDD